MHVGAVLHPEEASQHSVIVHCPDLHSVSGSGDLMVYPEPHSAVLKSAHFPTAVMQEHSSGVHTAAEQTLSGLPTVFPILEQLNFSQLVEETVGEASQHWVIVHCPDLHSVSGSGDLMVYPEPHSAVMKAAHFPTAVMQEHSALVHSAAEQTFKGLPTTGLSPVLAQVS